MVADIGIVEVSRPLALVVHVSTRSRNGWCKLFHTVRFNKMNCYDIFSSFRGLHVLPRNVH